MTDDEKVSRLRELLPATGAGIYLATAEQGPLPAETAAAMRDAEDWELNVGRAWADRQEDVLQREAEARAVIGALLGASPDQITLTHGLRDALELARDSVGSGGRVVDLTYRAGVTSIAVEHLNADAAVLACDRWLLGPEGTGALWHPEPPSADVRRELPRTTLIGLARSVGWLEMFVGLDWIFERTAMLADRLYAALADCSGVTVVTPRDELTGVVTFRVAGWPVAQVVETLSRRVHALVGVVPDSDAVRASVAWFNTISELDRFTAGVAELARFTPATMPQRPHLEVL